MTDAVVDAERRKLIVAKDGSNVAVVRSGRLTGSVLTRTDHLVGVFQRTGTTRRDVLEG